LIKNFGVGLIMMNYFLGSCCPSRERFNNDS